MPNEFIELYKRGNRNYFYEIFEKFHELRQKFTDLNFLYNNLEQVLDFERYVMNNRGKNRLSIEEKVLEFLQMLVYDLNENYEFDKVMLNEKLIIDNQDVKLKKVHKINLTLLNFAIEIFNISIPRDTFTSSRKGYCLGIIARLLEYYDIKNKFDLFHEALKSPKDNLIIEVLKVLHIYYENYPNEQLTQELINEFDRIILKTKNRYVATGSLNLQVITGHIDELEALDRISEWKENNNYY